MHTSDLTIVYYTANVVPSLFTLRLREHLKESSLPYPVICVSKIPSADYFENNIVVNTQRSHFNIYRDALTGAKAATTKWIVLCEDDQLYSPEHFKYRPKKKPFAYNLGYWGIFTWQDPPIYNYKGRRNLGNLICDREAFIEAMEERFLKYPNPTDDIKDVWAEPSKYEHSLGVTAREAEDFYTNPPNIKFSHETELSFAALGTRKRAGELRATEIPYWGHATEVRRLYN